MDPDEVLGQLLERVRTIRAEASCPDDEVLQLCDDVENLSDWLTKGGFPPARWLPGFLAAQSPAEIMSRQEAVPPSRGDSNA